MIDQVSYVKKTQEQKKLKSRRAGNIQMHGVDPLDGVTQTSNRYSTFLPKIILHNYILYLRELSYFGFFQYAK